jgi:O-antigen ligase
MRKIFGIGLVGGVALAVLAFGGTETPTISIVQIAILGLAILLLMTFDSLQVGSLKVPVLFSVVLVTFVLLQWARFSSGISIAPYETLSHLLLLVTYLAAYYLTIVVCRDREGDRRISHALLGLGAFEAAYGLFQYLTGWQRIFWYAKTVNLEMATGTYINYDHYAGLLEMILPFALALAYGEYWKISRQNSRAPGQLRNAILRGELQKLVLWLILATVLFAAIVFSQSRMGLMSAIVSALLMFVLAATSGWQRGWQRMSVAMLTFVFLFAGISLAVWIGPEPVMARFKTLGEQYGASANNRATIWKDTLRLIDAHPWVGTGLGTFSVAYPSVQTSFEGRLVSHAHNDYLEFASELGIPAAVILFGGIFYLLLQSAWSFRRNENRLDRAVALGCFGSILSILLHSMTDFNLQIPANALMVGVVLGMGYANSSKRLGGATPAALASRA